MCNLYSVRASQDELRGLFDVAPERDRLGNLGSLPAIFPRADAPVVRQGEDGAGELVAPVHPERMVAILPPEDWEAWLTAPPASALRLIRPFPAERMRVMAKGEGLNADS